MVQRGRAFSVTCDWLFTKRFFNGKRIAVHRDLAARDDRNDLQVLIEKHGIGAGADFKTTLIGQTQTVGSIAGDQRQCGRKREIVVTHEIDHGGVIPGDFAHGLPDDVSVGIKPRHNAVTVGRESDLLDRHAAGDGSAHGCGRVPQIAGAVRSDVDVTIRLLHGINAGALKEKLGSCAVRGAKMSADREPRCGDFFEDIKRIGDRPPNERAKGPAF